MGRSIYRNACHGSANRAAAARELKIFFKLTSMEQIVKRTMRAAVAELSRHYEQPQHMIWNWIREMAEFVND
jgi:hypothetical protein